MDCLSISQIQIVPISPKDGLVAFASATINGDFAVGGIAIFTSLNSPDGFRLVYPTKFSSTGNQFYCFRPLTKKAGDALHKPIIAEYLRIIDKFSARHGIYSGG
ncbi:MAG: septation protein SpoVG family protein [Candidatus Omnitrophica bacterium]|nr:septation protein SpoVG family protein [Candidatus Omnitrophota bacterium]